MKRILFVGAGYSFPKGAFAFLKSMQDQEPVSVTGLFFSPIEYIPMATASQIPIAAPYLRLREKERKAVEDNKSLFEKQCQQFHIQYQVHPNEEEWDREVLAAESRFSDMLLLSGELFYSDINANQPNTFMQEALHISECPVMIVPEQYTLFRRVVIAYDGSRESLYAIKHFCYLLPQFTDLPAEFIYAKEEDCSDIPDIDNLKKYSRLHFGSMSFSKLNFKAANYFSTWIGEKQDALLVSGSFGRSPFSYLAKHGFADRVVHDHTMPVFIAHP